MPAGKIETFDNGTPYVRAGDWAGFFAWLIDFAVFAFATAVGIVVVALVAEARGLGDGVVALSLFTMPFVAAILYGLCYTEGRALGAVCTGTRLVRVRDGDRIGAKGPWAMLVRTVLLPLLIIAAVAGGGYAPGTLKRISIDVARTRRLHAEGHPARR